ncbi:SWIM zinc finger family protein [Streptomyces populi]
MRRATAAVRSAGADAPAGAGDEEDADAGARPVAAVHPDAGPDTGIGAGARVRAHEHGPSDAPDTRDATLAASGDAVEAGSGQRPAGAPAGGPGAARRATAGRSGAETGGGARPGDVAREALRAARSEALRLRSEETDGGERSKEGEDRGAGPRRRPTRTSPPGARGRRSPAHPVTMDRAAQQRRLRDLLEDAFRLPPDVAAETGQPSRPADDAGEGIHGRPHDRLARPQHTEHIQHVEPTRHTEPTRRVGHSAYPEPVDHPGHSPYPMPEREAPTAVEPFTVGSLVPELFTSEPFTEPREPSAPSGSPESSDPPAPGVPHRDSHASRPSAGALDRTGAAGTGGPVTSVPAERLPRSMAAPDRDGELRRTFPAFPARAREDDGFAETWWGDAWVRALEEGALDAARLARGRTYAGHGHVDAVTVTPGLVLAYVHGSRPRPYRVQVRVRTLTDDDWDRFLDAAAERPGHIAALLDKEMPRSLADCGVELLPGPGELEPHCSCPDFGHPCKHAAALCYQTARLLDQDPFVLLLLRGRGERELLDALSRRSATRAARAAQEREPEQPAGVRAGDVLARRVLPPLPAPLPPPAHPEQPPAYPGAPGGPDPFALDQLATDAAARAHALLTSGRDPVAELTLWQDAVRIAAARPGSGLTAATRALYSSLASATGRTPVELARAVAAWRQGGIEALGVLEEAWDPPAGRFDRARPLLMAADLPAFRPWRNHLTHPHGHAQLRLGRDGLWYAYESEPGRDDWWPRGTPDLDPVGALTELGVPDEL